MNEKLDEIISLLKEIKRVLSGENKNSDNGWTAYYGGDTILTTTCSGDIGKDKIIKDDSSLPGGAGGFSLSEDEIKNSRWSNEGGGH